MDISNQFIANNNNKNYYYETDENFTSKNNTYSKRLEENYIIDSESADEDDKCGKLKKLTL